MEEKQEKIPQQKAKPKQRKRNTKKKMPSLSITDEKDTGNLSSITLLFRDMDEIEPLTDEKSKELGEAVQAGILAKEQLELYAGELSEPDKEALVKLQKAGEAASQTLVEHNLPLVAYLAKNFIDKGLPYEDLLQEGFLSMTRAAKTYDPSKGKFGTYIGAWVKCDLKKAINQENCGAVSLPNHVLLAHGKIQGAKRKMESVSGQEMSTKQAAKHLGMSERLADHAETLWEASRTISTDLPAYEDNPRTTSQNITLGEMIADDLEASLEIVASSNASSTLRELMRERLSPIEEVCTNLRFGIEDDVQRDLASIAAEVGLTKAGVHEVVQRSLRKLHEANARCDLTAFLRS